MSGVTGEMLRRPSEGVPAEIFPGHPAPLRLLTFTSALDLDFDFDSGPARPVGVNSDLDSGDESHDPPEVEPPPPPPPNWGGLPAWKPP